MLGHEGIGVAVLKAAGDLSGSSVFIAFDPVRERRELAAGTDSVLSPGEFLPESMSH